jgi:hypothetical protein
MCERVRGVHRQGWRLGWWGGGGGGAVDCGMGVKGKSTAACGHKGGGGGGGGRGAAVATLNSNGGLQLCPASVSQELY